MINMEMTNRITFNELQLISKVDIIFTLSYLLLGVCSFNSVIAFSPAFRVLTYLVFAFGASMLCYRLINYKTYLRSRYLIILVFFVCSYIVSMVFNKQYGIIENLQGLSWITMIFGLLYANSQEESQEVRKYKFETVMKFYVGYVFLANIVGIGMFVVQFGDPTAEITNTYSGFIWGRLWGLYSDPNKGAIMSIIAIIYLLYKALTNGDRKNTFIYIQVFVNYFYVFLSDSRTGLLGGFIGLSFFVFFYMFERWHKHSFIKKVILSTLIVLGSMTSLHIVDFGLSHLITDVVGRNVFEKKNNLELSGLDNRRMAIWTSSVEVWTYSPIVGTSARNSILFAQDHCPDTYVVNNDMGNFDSAHNFLLDVLVFQGVIGVAIILTFIVNVFKDSWSLLCSGPLDLYVVTLFSCIIVLGVSGLLQPDMLYVNSSNTILFWFMLGIIMQLPVKKKNVEDIHNEKNSNNI